MTSLQFAGAMMWVVICLIAIEAIAIITAIHTTSMDKQRRLECIVKSTLTWVVAMALVSAVADSVIRFRLL